MKMPFAIAALACALAFGPAQAQETKTPPSMRLMDMMMLGEGTVTGTVARIGPKWFALNDGQQTVDVTSRDIVLDDLKPGDTVTVTGTASRGTVRPTEIRRADGTPLPKRTP